MSLTYGFYNSVNGDRTYDAEDFSRFFDGIVSDGVLLGVGTGFGCTANGNEIVVGTGRAWFNKTWSYNDAPVSLELPSASGINNRMDYLCLEIDTRQAVRENKFVFVEGEPSVSPSAPVLSPPTGVFQYPLYRIYRRRDINAIRPEDLLRTVGTSVCPIASNALVNIQTYDNLSHKRSIVRGANLGSSFTSAQRAAVRSGSFEGLYLGDYWQHNNTNWRIVDFDYVLGHAQGPNEQEASSATTVRIEDHHICIVPDDTRALFATETPFTGGAKKASNCGFDFSTRARTRLTNIASRLGSLVGTSNLLAPYSFIPSTYSSANRSMNRTARYMRGVPLVEQMVIGNQGLGLPFSTRFVDQLALYKHGVRNFWMGHDRNEVPNIPTGAQFYGPTWFANQFNIDNWTCFHDWMGVSTENPRTSSTHQLRPMLAVTGKA